MITIRSLLDALDEVNHDAIDRLCDIRETGGRSRADKCESLARSFRGNHAEFFETLRKVDLVTLLTDPTELDGEEYYLPSAAAYSKADLVEFAIEAFEQEEIPEEFEIVDEDDEDGDHDDPDDDDPDDDEDDDEEQAWGGYEAVEGELDLSFDFNPAKANTSLRRYQENVVAALRNKAVRPGGQYLVHIATGGGKTRVANDWLRQHVLPSGKRVLWVTKDWELLRQAASDLCQRYEDIKKYLGRVGGGPRLEGLKEGAGHWLVYTTIQTWNARSDKDFNKAQFDVVVIDEVHWGEAKPAYRRLRKRYGEQAVFVGLTATPRSGSAFTTLDPSYSFSSLIDLEVLARPDPIDRVHTGVSWTPDVRGSHGDFTGPSLAALGKNNKRNQLIVSTWNEAHGKTLVFACNVEHAVMLARRFQEANVSAEALHSQMTTDERRVALARFRHSKTKVLVNVAMLTHGVDIPDIKTVFLARPTASKTLFSQMVGRGARRTDEKTTFGIVDFADNIKAHNDALVDTNAYFGALGGTSRAPTSGKPRGPRLKRHAYEPAKLLHFPAKPGYEALAGLEFQSGQTFGIEFEFTRDDFKEGSRPRDWDKVAADLLTAIRQATPHAAKKALPKYGMPEKDNDDWNVEFDASCWWEVTSRILRGLDGIEEVADVLRAIEPVTTRHRLILNARTGTHIHIAWKLAVPKLRALFELVASYEPALYSLVSRSRAGNAYCRSIREGLPALRELDDAGWKRHFSKWENRYLLLNPVNLFAGKEYGTLEVRLHNGTQEPQKILTWLSLWMRMVEATNNGLSPMWAGQSSPFRLALGDEGDVLKLAKEVGGSQALRARLHDRRMFVVANSWRSDADYRQFVDEALKRWHAASP